MTWTISSWGEILLPFATHFPTNNLQVQFPTQIWSVWEEQKSEPGKTRGNQEVASLSSGENRRRSHSPLELSRMLNQISLSPAARPNVTEAPLIDFSTPQVKTNQQKTVSIITKFKRGAVFRLWELLLSRLVLHLVWQTSRFLANLTPLAWNKYYCFRTMMQLTWPTG